MDKILQRTLRVLAPVVACMAMLLIGAVVAQAQPSGDQNHFRCYIVSQQTPQPGETITLEDQFNEGDPQTVTVGEPIMINNVRVTTPTLFCNPAEKVSADGTFEILDEDLHLACYEIHGKQKTQQHTVGVENQFETDVFQTGPWEILCAPSEKTLPE